jgi:hypothetical protein
MNLALRKVNTDQFDNRTYPVVILSRRLLAGDIHDFYNVRRSVSPSHGVRSPLEGIMTT